MIGEMFRDAAVLVAVFVPLEVFGAFHYALGPLLSILIVQSTVITCVVLGWIGIAVERRRVTRT
jgi:hypothetical protein